MRRNFCFFAMNYTSMFLKKTRSFERPFPPIRELQLLWRLATNTDYRTISHLFGISRASVSVIVEEFCSAVTSHLAPKHIKIPTGNELNKLSPSSKQNGHFPQSMGAVDGSHTPMKAPVNFHADYQNRKG